MRLSRPTLLIVILLSCGVGNGFAQSWVDYAPEGCHCSFQLPGNAQVHSDEFQGTLTREYEVTYLRKQYKMFLTHYANATGDSPGKMAEKALASYGKATRSTVRDEGQWQVGEHTGRQALLSMDIGNAEMLYRTVFSGNWQYTMLIICPAGVPDDPISGVFFGKIADLFFTSLKVD